MTIERDPLDDLEEAEEIFADLGINPDAPGSTNHPESGMNGPEAAPGGGPDPSPTLRELKAEALARSESLAFESLASVADIVAANLDFSSLVRQILDIALQAVGAERGIIFLGDESVPELTPMVARSIEGSDVEALERVSRTVLQRSRRGELIATENAMEHPDLLDIPSIRVQQLRSLICVPMRARGRQVGALYVDSLVRESAFPRHSLRFLEAFAGLAAVAIENARHHGDILRENKRLQNQIHSLESFGRIITTSGVMTRALERAAMIARADAPVMILGESGTGKELLARSIHEASSRSLRPFVPYNCAAVPRDLAESLFFGHVKGAFTGASRDAAGLFREAHEGTLFLDEFAELGMDIQAKFLRVLEDGVVRSLGGATEDLVDFRLITATSRSMEDALREGRFREDLFYRSNVLEVQIPPLRERLEDIPLLVDHFRTKHRSEDREPPRFSTAAIARLQELPWRGNVRELENVVQRLLVLCQRPMVDADDLAQLMPGVAWGGGRQSPGGFVGSGEPPNPTGEADAAGVSPPESDATGSSPESPVGNGCLTPDENGRYAVSPSIQLPSTTAPPPTRLEDQERLSIVRALLQAGGNKSKAARVLGIHRNSFLRRMDKLGVDWVEPS